MSIFRIDLVAFRERAGLTQVEVANAMGVAQGRVSVLERTGNPKWDVLVRYARACGAVVDVSKGRVRVEVVK